MIDRCTDPKSIAKYVCYLYEHEITYIRGHWCRSAINKKSESDTAWIIDDTVSTDLANRIKKEVARNIMDRAAHWLNQYNKTFTNYTELDKSHALFQAWNKFNNKDFVQAIMNNYQTIQQN